MTDARIVCFGEMLLRFAPVGEQAVRNTHAFAVHVAGAEANVAISLSALGLSAAMATILPENALGDRALDTLTAYGVDAGACVRVPGRMGTFYIESPRAGREGGFFYDRTGSAFALGAGAIDWERALSGAAWLHLSGITAALGDAPVQAMRSAVDAATRLGVAISFDCNFRPILWQDREDLAAELLFEFASSAQLVFANDWDARLLLGPGTRASSSTADASRVLLKVLPVARWIVATRRERDGDVPRLGALLSTHGGTIEIPLSPITPFVDRVGGGDAFAAGLLFGLASGWDEERSLRFAHRACIMKHAIPGDFSTLSAADVERAILA